MASVLRDGVYDNLVTECEEDIRFEEDECDPDWIADDEDSTTRRGHGSDRFGNVEVTEEACLKVFSASLAEARWGIYR